MLRLMSAPRGTVGQARVIASDQLAEGRRVDSSGNTYLLQRLVIKGDKKNRSIVVPSYVKDIAKVQIWCAYAEVLLGEASFPAPVK